MLKYIGNHMHGFFSKKYLFRMCYIHWTKILSVHPICCICYIISWGVWFPFNSNVVKNDVLILVCGCDPRTWPLKLAGYHKHGFCLVFPWTFGFLFVVDWNDDTLMTLKNYAKKLFCYGFSIAKNRIEADINNRRTEYNLLKEHFRYQHS